MAGIAQVSEELDITLFSWLTHGDVKETFSQLKRVAKSAGDSLGETKKLLEQLCTSHNLVVKYSDLHGERLNTLDGHVGALDLRAREDRTVITRHVEEITALKSRVSQLEETRLKDVREAFKTVGVINQLGKQLAKLEEAFEKKIKNFEARFEELELDDKEVKESVEGLSKSHEDMKAKLIALEKNPTKEVAVKLRELWQRHEDLTGLVDHQMRENEELKSQNAEMSQMIHTLVKNMGTLFEWKEKASEEHARQYRLQITYLGVLATMHKHMDAKIDRLLETNGLRIEMPSEGSPAPSQDLRSIMQELAYHQ